MGVRAACASPAAPAPWPRWSYPLLALCSIVLLLQSTFGLIAGWSGSWSPVHRHVALGAVPVHGHAYDGPGAPVERCGDPLHDMHGGDHASKVTCVAGDSAATGSITTSLRSEELSTAVAAAGSQSMLLDATVGPPLDHNAEPPAPPPRP